MKTLEFKGKSLENAIINAEEELRIPRDLMKIEITENKTMYSLLDKNKVTITVSYLEEEAEKYIEENLKYEENKKDILEYIKNLNEIYPEHKFRVKCYKDNKCLVVELKSKINAYLIGKEGRNLENITNLFKSIVRNRNIRLHVKIGDYKEKDVIELEKLAEETLTKVLETGETIKLNPMNAYQRKVIHNYLQKYNVTSGSEGVEPNRYIVVAKNTTKK